MAIDQEEVEATADLQSREQRAREELEALVQECEAEDRRQTLKELGVVLNPESPWVCYAVCNDPEDRRLVFMAEQGPDGKRVYWLTAPPAGVNEYRVLTSEEERAAFNKSYEQLCRKRGALSLEKTTKEHNPA
jgi:hypothetical protein